MVSVRLSLVLPNGFHTYVSISDVHPADPGLPGLIFAFNGCDWLTTGVPLVLHQSLMCHLVQGNEAPMALDV